MTSKVRGKKLYDCSECGEPYVRHTNEKTCSEKCSDIRTKRVANREFNNKIGDDRVCVVCGKGFKGTHTRQVCSQACGDERARNYHRDYYRERENISNTRECEYCGKEFERVHKNLYCSDKCRDEAVRVYNRIKKRESRERLKREAGVS